MENINIENLKMENLNQLQLVNNYIPIAEKIKVIDMILENGAEINNGVISINRVSVNVALTIMIVPLYFNIEINKTDFETYDIISRFDLMNLIPNKEKTEWENLLNNSILTIEEENSYEQIVGRILNNFKDRVVTTLDMVDKFLDKGNPNEISKYLSKGIEILASKLPNFNEQKK